ncbi:1-acyl-sn-glycerol-3-phosphate acyltransferase [Planctomycetes bacterium K23_9]|uniref:Acyltransferase n=1 Tax=Stieleria marina TaxID=1930275 RepID=A0A517P3G7_9BACT|nr:Acyltransferase [Planctomycetes bacterium K23_9]
MHAVVLDEPYQFVPPHHGTLWPRFLQLFLRRRLRKDFGIQQYKWHGLEKIRDSVAAGHSVVLAPNHCRPADPLVVNELCHQVGLQPQMMASWHVFKTSWLHGFVLRRVGAFSVYREGTDRQALNAAIEILTQANRPLVIFPEGVITRTNDRLLAMMEGLSFIARSAAKKRTKDNSDAKVVVHPVAIRYRFHGDAEKELHAALDDIEERLSWRPQKGETLKERIHRIGKALLWLKEIEYFGQPQTGAVAERLQNLIDKILVPMENEWIGDGESQSDKTPVARVKQLRSAVLPDMIDGDLGDDEKDRRWDQLAGMYMAQQLGHYPPDYVSDDPTNERMLETVEKFEEDLTDHSRIYRPMSVEVSVGDPIEVTAKRVRGQQDPVMLQLESDMRRMLGIAGE